MLAKRIGKDDEQKYEQAGGKIGDQAIGAVSHFGFAFPDEPAGTEKRIAEAEADAAQDRKRAEPTEFATSVVAIGDGKTLDDGPDRQALNESGQQGSPSEAS